MSEAMEAYRLAGKAAIITGAASGIGRATAELFADVGATVIIADLNEAAAVDLATRIGRGAAGIGCDVSNAESVDAMFRKALPILGGRLDVLVNNAAYRPKADTMTMPASEWDIMHAVIARGTFLCLREAVKIMRQQGGGAIVNISSVSAKHPTIFSNMHYDSAKAGVDAITRAAAIEFAGDNIRVNSVQPGGTDTAGSTKLRSAIPITGPMVQPGRMALGRVAQPIEQARAVLFLASDASSYITGHHLTVDGGYHVS